MGSTFFGMRHTDSFAVYDAATRDWIKGEDRYLTPETHRDLLLMLEPNGNAPLTALSSLLKKENTDSPFLHWYTKSFPSFTEPIDGVFVDATLATAYVSGGVLGTVLYVRCSEDSAQFLRPGTEVLFRSSTDIRMTVAAKVTNVYRNGDVSVVSVILLEADDNAPAVVGGAPEQFIANADYMTRIGSVHPENSGLPPAVSEQLVKFDNFTQIFLTPFGSSRTNAMTRMRWGSDGFMRELEMEALKRHATELEMALMFGVMSEREGDNGFPERTMNGIWSMIRNNGGHITDFRYEPNFAGETWLNAGADWMDFMLERVFAFDSSKERIAYCGSGVITAINQYIRYSGTTHYSISHLDTAYGLKVQEWVTPYGSIYFQIHPLFAQDPIMHTAAVIFDPRDLVVRPLLDTEYIQQANKKNFHTSGGPNFLDGVVEAFLTEISMELYHPIKTGIMAGFGANNLL